MGLNPGFSQKTMKKFRSFRTMDIQETAVEDKLDEPGHQYRTNGIEWERTEKSARP